MPGAHWRGSIIVTSKLDVPPRRNVRAAITAPDAALYE
jgi:hypothetical protein